MVHRGFTYPQIIAALLLDETTIRRYVKSFKQEGPNGLLQSHYTGGHPRLTKAQELELKNHLAEGEHIYLTAKEVMEMELSLALKELV